MDGVLFRGKTALSGAGQFLPWLRDHRIRFKLLTNNSTATAHQNAAKLAGMGIEVNPEAILTSAQATAQYLLDRGAAGDSAYVVGEDGLRIALSEVGVTVSDSPQGVQWVVAGLDRHATYETLGGASLAIERGAKFVASNADGSLPVEEGFLPGAGALQAAIIATTGIRPVVIGKPEPAMLQLGMKQLDGDLTTTAMLGDRLDTDVEAAHRIGMMSILVLTGVTTEAELRKSELQPDAVFSGLPQLMAVWP